MFATFQNMIDAWPSLAAFADDAGVAENTAKGMRRRDSVHAAYWTGIVAGAAKRGIQGVTLEVLAELAKGRAARSEGEQEADAA
jgi:hypothetical protein